MQPRDADAEYDVTETAANFKDANPDQFQDRNYSQDNITITSDAEMTPETARGKAMS
jgi:hypothetical protein